MKTGVKNIVMRPQSKKYLELPETGSSKEIFFPSSLWREQGIADTIILGFWPPRL